MLTNSSYQNQIIEQNYVCICSYSRIPKKYGIMVLNLIKE